MRWIVLALLGVVLAAIGAVNLLHEVGHGSDIWQRHNTGIALLALGVVLVLSGLSGRANGAGSGRSIWPGVGLFAVLAAIALALYAVTPPLAVLFLIVVLPFGLGGRAERWLGRD